MPSTNGTEISGWSSMSRHWQRTQYVLLRLYAGLGLGPQSCKPRGSKCGRHRRQDAASAPFARFRCGPSWGALVQSPQREVGVKRQLNRDMVCYAVLVAAQSYMYLGAALGITILPLAGLAGLSETQTLPRFQTPRRLTRTLPFAGPAMSHGAAHAFAPASTTTTPTTPTKPEILRGWVKTTRDAMLVFEATRVGIVPRVTRRFHELEKRSIIRSGAIFVFTEEESGIKRWTDPYLWSASRMQGNFLMYRERDDEHGPQMDSPYRCSAMSSFTEYAELLDPELEHYILGSWNKGKGLKKNGLMKKAISISIEGTVYHLISYYYPSDVRSGVLQTPSSMPHLASLELSPAIMRSFSQVRHSTAPGKPKRGRPPRSRIVQLERPTGLLLSIPSTPAPSPGTMTPSHEWYSPVTASDTFAPASCPAPRSLPFFTHSEAYTYTRSSSSPPSEVHPYHSHHQPNLNAPGGSSSSMVYTQAAEAPWSHTSSSGALPSYPFPVYDYDYESAPVPHHSEISTSAPVDNSMHTTSQSEQQYSTLQYFRYPQDVGIPAAEAYYPGTLYP